MAERSGKALNDSQARHLVGVLSHVDQLLGSVEAAMRAPRSPFARLRPDLGRDDPALVEAFVRLARERMAQACDRLGVARAPPSVSARWAAETALHFADEAFADLAPDTMRGYGPLSDEAARELTGVYRALQQLMRDGVRLLRGPEGVELMARARAVPPPVGEILRALADVVDRRGAVEVRPLLAHAIERGLGQALDVGVFGRVSAGKSSLLRAVLDTDALPVGATPVTAVPLLISRGAPRLEVWLADGARRTTDAGELRTYVTEQENAHNTRGVTSLELCLPSVPAGVRFLDTPGVGSLSASGPAQAFAALPRCDLALVLVAAGSSVAADDAALVSGLARAGIPFHVLLSKCDLLSADELGRAREYVRAEIARAVGHSADIPVRAVSSRAGFERSIARVREEIIEPESSSRARAAGHALRTRIRALIAATEAASNARLDMLEFEVRTEWAADRTLRSIRGIADRLTGSGRRALEDASEVVADAWASAGDPRTVALDVLRRPALDAQEEIRQTLDDARAELGGDGSERRLPPLFDPSWAESIPDLRAPLGHRVLGRTLAMARLSSLGPAISDSYERFAARLTAWAEAEVARARASPEDRPHAPARDPELAHIEAMVAAWEAEVQKSRTEPTAERGETCEATP